jgi:hypothetical protein
VLVGAYLRVGRLTSGSRQAYRYANDVVADKMCVEGWVSLEIPDIPCVALVLHARKLWNFEGKLHTAGPLSDSQT